MALQSTVLWNPIMCFLFFYPMSAGCNLQGFRKNIRRVECDFADPFFLGTAASDFISVLNLFLLLAPWNYIP